MTFCYGAIEMPRALFASVCRCKERELRRHQQSESRVREQLVCEADGVREEEGGGKFKLDVGGE